MFREASITGTLGLEVFVATGAAALTEAVGFVVAAAGTVSGGAGAVSARIVIRLAVFTAMGFGGNGSTGSTTALDVWAWCP